MWSFYRCTYFHHRKFPHRYVTTAPQRDHFQCSSQSLRRGWLIHFLIHSLWQKAYSTHCMWVGYHSCIPCYRYSAEMEGLRGRAVASKGSSENRSDKLSSAYSATKQFGDPGHEMSWVMFGGKKVAWLTSSMLAIIKVGFSSPIQVPVSCY